MNKHPVAKPGPLQEQIDFYRAHAPEYGRSGAYHDQLEDAKAILRTMGPFEQVLELACGPGAWTKELVGIGRRITALDASPEMLERNRGHVASARVHYRQADLFQWEPERRYDLVFMAFWLSHVPPDRVDTFLDKARRAVCPGGKIFVVDQCEDFRDRPPPDREGIYEKRRTADGRTFTVVKVYYHPALLADRLKHFAFEATSRRIGDSFFFILGTRR
ncbi:MAG TPA: class I SAM-dependent methyltransferase [bacterium]|nr:class I SAM-dependent methyltransferase [bacterium]